MGQLTRAYNKSGTIRFDALREMRAKHPSILGELSWANVYERPDLQIAAITLKLRDDHKNFRETPDWIYFTDAAYNGGVAGVQRDRRACTLASWCDPNKWFGNVELTCTKSKRPLYGNRSACDINRHHVVDVMKRSEKYKYLWKK